MLKFYRNQKDGNYSLTHFNSAKLNTINSKKSTVASLYFWTITNQ
ncbi:hypothetical protein SAMN04487999_3187 [Leeuwenhoekiella palythoae]|uniref:Uncharacterized protein n=1 Tax=Leeuwenhoekiella palythoae TaxID=573501 RepID=A0A1M5ZK09_9FLAO|nr:hypothetical protein DSM01_2940 [Leeuwenhoekiella palythoae]SHI24685.1 hypothetical protein SAMN04487999_3187 [Leeuwenhoekiella palythoae]